MRQFRDLCSFVLRPVIAPKIILSKWRHPGPTGITLDPVVSSAIASTTSPAIPACFTAARVASANARMWSSCDCVAYSGSSRLRWSGYSASAEASSPRLLSTRETRTLRVPKSTPATMAIKVPSCHASTSASRDSARRLRGSHSPRRKSWLPRDARSRSHRCNAASSAGVESQPHRRRQRYSAGSLVNAPSPT